MLETVLAEWNGEQKPCYIITTNSVIILRDRHPARDHAKNT